MADEYPTTARQRDYAITLGLSPNPESHYEELDGLIQQARRDLDSPATQEQKELARQWGLTFSDSTTRGELSGLLYGFLSARAWVYTVCRKVAGAKWRLHSESGLPEDVVNEAAKAIVEDDLLRQQVRDQTFGTSTTGDVWYRITERTTAIRAFRVVAEKVTVIRPTSCIPPRRSSHSGCMVAATLFGIGALILIEYFR